MIQSVVSFVKYIDRDETLILLMHYFTKLSLDYFKWNGRYNGIHYFLKENVSDRPHLSFYSISEGKGNPEL